MFNKRRWLIVLVASAVVLALAIGLQLSGVAQARPPAQQSNPTITIPYPGRLTEDAGQAVADGDYDFSFVLYDAEIEGTLLWSEVQEGVTVRDGGFVVSLGSSNPISADLLEGGERWLEVAVRGPGEAEFTALTPRQHISGVSPSPAAGIHQAAPCPHDHMGEAWSLTSPDISIMFRGVFVAFQATGDSWGGVWGDSSTNVGVQGTSDSAQGVVGQSQSGYGGQFECVNDERYDLRLGGDEGWVNALDTDNSELHLRANGDVTAHIDYDGDGANFFDIKNGLDFDVCWVDEDGNLTCTGTKSAVVDTPSYGSRKLYAVESPEVWHEDFGTATLVDGVAVVSIEPIFAETVNLEEGYHVFLTPLGDCQGLYVAAKTPTSFEVRELGGGKANISFDYRIVAKRLGHEDLRLEPPARPQGRVQP